MGSWSGLRTADLQGMTQGRVGVLIPRVEVHEIHTHRLFLQHREVSSHHG